MLKKENRLKSNRAFNTTYSNNCLVADYSVVLYIGFKKNAISRPTRVGFVVSKKVHKRAVVRNRIKRLIRESVRLQFKENKVPDSFQSMIFLAKSGMIGKNFDEVDKIVKQLFQKVSNKYL